jgi:hypothetical protein
MTQVASSFLYDDAKVYILLLAVLQCEYEGHFFPFSYEQAFLSSTYIRDSGAYWTDLREVLQDFAFSNGDRPLFTNWAANEPGRPFCSMVRYGVGIATSCANIA